MSYEVRNAEIEELLRKIGRQLKETMPEGYGFALLIFTYAPGAFFYISSADREGMIEQLKEAIEKLKS
jgi:hypothetical protein